MVRVRLIALAISLPLIPLVAGCLSNMVPGHAATDEAQLSGMLGRGDFRGAGFVRMNAAPYASDLEPGSLINMFVSADAAAAYESIQPGLPSAGAAFPVGGVVVREVVGGALTVLVKREPGYFPAVGDLFFGVTDAHGVPREDGAHVEWGALADCATCHEQRATSDFLFGVAMSNREKE